MQATEQLEFQNTDANKMSRSQKRAFAYLCRFFNERMESDRKYGAQPDIRRLRVQTIYEKDGKPNLISLTFSSEAFGLPENNLLRYHLNQHWHVIIGRRGGIEVKACPKSFKQFHGRHVYGMKFNVKY